MTAVLRASSPVQPSAGAGHAIRTSGLTKRFGSLVAVDALDLEVGRGEVFGFIGPNGAGKSTTIRLLLDFLRPTSGVVEVLGRDSRRGSVEIRRRTGYLPGDLRLPPKLTGEAVLDYFDGLRGAGRSVDRDELVGLLDVDLHRPVRELSRGNRQKVGLVQALMHRPELIVLDEPTSGLDPLVQQRFHQLVASARDRGATVFVSSHVLSEVQTIADRAAVLRQGRVVAVESMADLRRRTTRQIEIRFAEPVPAAEFAALAGVHDLRVDGGRILRCRIEGDADAIVKAAARHRVVTITSADLDLEDVFLDLYRSDRHAA